MEQAPALNTQVDFELLFQAMPGLHLLLSPDLRILAATRSYLKATGTTDAAITGKPFFEVFTSGDLPWNNTALEEVRVALQAVLHQKEAVSLKPIRFDVTQEQYWEASNTPVLNATGDIVYIIHEARDITEQVLTERKAKVFRDNLELMSITANGTLWECDLQQDTITWSDSYKELFGYTDQESEHAVSGWANSIHPQDIEPIRQSFKKYIEEQAANFTVEYRFLRADGTYADVLSHGYILYNEAGQPLHLVGSAVDVSLQRTHERQLTDINERFQRVATVTSDVIWDWSLADDSIWWNEGYKTLFGHSAAGLLHTISSWTDFIHPEDYDRIHESIYQVINSGKTDWQYEYRFRCADGTYKLVLDRGMVMHDEQGRATRMIGAMVDITEKKQVELELQESKERFERVAMATNDVVWDWNVTDGSHWVNDGFKRLFGYMDQDIKQTLDTCTSRIHPEDYERVVSSVQQALDTGQELWEQEYRFRCANGDHKLIQDKGYIIRNSNGEPTRMIGAMRDITEKRQFELQLQESTARITQILETLPLMTWTATPKGDVDYYSSRWFELTGADFSKLKNWGWKNFIHPDDFKISKERWLHCLATGEVFTVENRWKSARQDAYRWFLARAVPIRDSEGNITMWVGSHTDIEEQKQALLTLQESSDKFKLLAESVPHIIWSGNPDGHVDYFNRQWYNYTRMTEEETLGFGWALTLHPDDLKATTAAWLHSMHTGERYERELRLRDTLTDCYRWFLARALPVRNASGEIIKWFGTATDIHDQKMLREQVQESEMRFRFLTESIPQMVWTATAQGVTDYFNNRWIAYTGLSLEESLGEDAWLKALHPDDHERARARWQEAVITGKFYEIEYRIINGDSGQYHWFLGQAVPMHDESGVVVKWFGTCTDIEDHKKAEEELVEKNLELERINQDLDSFVYTASHDLKLPIINMAGIFEELTRSAEFSDPEAPQLIEMFNKSLKQLHNTIYDLSEVVRVQKAKDHEMDNLSLQHITSDVLVSVQEMALDAGAKIQFDFSLAPEVAFPRASLKSILYNLISNAIKYRAQDRLPEISISSRVQDQYLELKVQDNGLGIDLNKHQDKLFQMFKRFHNHVKGSGLGLYIVNRLLVNHGGYINIESTLDEGTTFYLYFKHKKRP